MAEANLQEARIHGRKILGTFSTDENQKYCNDNRNRRFYIEPDNETDFDYTKGFHKYVDMEEDARVTSLESVLSWMRDHRNLLIANDILDTTASRLNMDFVGRRGTFKNLLEAGGNRKTDIRLVVTLFRGTYYISEFSGLWKTSKRPQTREGRLRAASSKLFLQFITSKDGCNQDITAPLNDNASYYAVMSALCGEHRMLFSFEVQAELKDELTPPPWNYINVRTNGEPSINPMKALRWWAPNVLVDIPEIVCGLRDDKHGIVRTFQYIQTNKLSIEYTQRKWEAQACFRTMESLLSQIRELVQEDNISSVYHLVLEPVDEEGQDLDHHLPSRRFVSRGKRTDDFTFINESLLHLILESD
nr:decapping and exoribonuclease protein-like [Lytechinus pictus]